MSLGSINGYCSLPPLIGLNSLNLIKDTSLDKWFRQKNKFIGTGIICKEYKTWPRTDDTVFS